MLRLITEPSIKKHINLSPVRNSIGSQVLTANVCCLVCFSRTFFVIFAQFSRGRAALFSVQQRRVSSTDPFSSNSGMSRLGRRSAPSPLSALGTSRTDCCIFSRWDGSLQRLLTKFGHRISKPLFVEV